MTTTTTATTTWNDVQAFVRKRYLLQQDEPAHFVMHFELPRSPTATAAAPPSTPSGREAAEPALAEPALDGPSRAANIQTLHVQHLPGSDGQQSWLLLRAEVCGERAMSPTAALRHSARLLIGALSLSGNHYVLRYTLPLLGLELSTLEYTLDYVVREAGSLRKRVLSQTGSPPRTALGQPLND